MDGYVGRSINGQGMYNHLGHVILEANLGNPLRHGVDNTASSLPSSPCLRTEDDNHTVDVWGCTARVEDGTVTNGGNPIAKDSYRGK